MDKAAKIVLLLSLGLFIFSSGLLISMFLVLKDVTGPYPYQDLYHGYFSLAGLPLLFLGPAGTFFLFEAFSLDKKYRLASVTLVAMSGLIFLIIPMLYEAVYF